MGLGSGQHNCRRDITIGNKNLKNVGVSALIESIPSGIGVEDYKCWTLQQVHALRSRYFVTEKALLISVSRMAKEKNLDFLIDGLAKLKELICTPFKRPLVGDGPEMTRLEEKAAPLGLDKQVVFRGNMPSRNVARCYLDADIFVFADVVKDGHNGLMVAERTKGWAKAMATLLTDRRRLFALSENSRVFTEDYSEDKIAEKVLRLYRRVVVLGKSNNA